MQNHWPGAAEERYWEGPPRDPERARRASQDPAAPTDAPGHGVRAQLEEGRAPAEGVRPAVRKAGLPPGRQDLGAELRFAGSTPLCSPTPADGRDQALRALRPRHCGDIVARRRSHRPNSTHLLQKVYSGVRYVNKPSLPGRSPPAAKVRTSRRNLREESHSSRSLLRTAHFSLPAFRVRICGVCPARSQADTGPGKPVNPPVNVIPTKVRDGHADLPFWAFGL